MVRILSAHQLLEPSKYYPTFCYVKIHYVEEFHHLGNCYQCYYFFSLLMGVVHLFYQFIYKFIVWVTLYKYIKTFLNQNVILQILNSWRAYKNLVGCRKRIITSNYILLGIVKKIAFFVQLHIINILSNFYVM